MRLLEITFSFLVRAIVERSIFDTWIRMQGIGILYEETIVAGNMEEAKKTAQESNPEAKIVSANWVYK